MVLALLRMRVHLGQPVVGSDEVHDRQFPTFKWRICLNRAGGGQPSALERCEERRAAIGWVEERG